MSVPDLLKIVTSGLQDSRLQPKGQPSVDKFTKVYRSSTRWAAQWIRVDFDNEPVFGGTATITLPRRAELVHRLILVVNLPDIYTTQYLAARAAGDNDPIGKNNFAGPSFAYTQSVGHVLLQNVSLEIGGVRVSDLTGQLMEVLDELHDSPEKTIMKEDLIGRQLPYSTNSLIKKRNLTLQIPIPFWFTRDPSQSLPIDALSNDKIKLSFKFNTFDQLWYSSFRDNSWTGPMTEISNTSFYKKSELGNYVIYDVEDPTFTTCRARKIKNLQMPSNFPLGDTYLLAEYISLDEAESIRMRSKELEYKIPLHTTIPAIQTQGQGIMRVPMPYGNPVQDLFWLFHNPDADQFNAHFTTHLDISGFNPFSNVGIGEPLAKAELLYNGMSRFSHDFPSLFRALIPLLNYAKAPLYWRYIYVYSFAHKPAKSWTAPRGLANWDRIVRKELVLTLRQDIVKDLDLRVWLTSWNVLRVFGGRAALLFAI